MQEARNNNRLSPHGCKSKWPIMSISNSHDSWVELTLIGNNWYPIVDYKKIFNRGFVFSLRPMSVIVQKIELNCWPSSISPYLLFCNGWIPTFESPIHLHVDDSNVLSLFGATKVSGSNPIVSMWKFLVVFSVNRLDLLGVLPTTTCQLIFKKPTRGVSHLWPCHLH